MLGTADRVSPAIIILVNNENCLGVGKNSGPFFYQLL